MCDSCKCGCKPGKPAKGCDCQCKDCRAAREGVSKSGRLVPVSEFSKKYDKYQAVNDAGMLPGAIGGSILGAYAARRRRPAVMLGTTLAGSLAGSVAGGAATTPIRRKMARKDRESAKVGKSLVELSKAMSPNKLKALTAATQNPGWSGTGTPGGRYAKKRLAAYRVGAGMGPGAKVMSPERKAGLVSSLKDRSFSDSFDARRLGEGARSFAPGRIVGSPSINRSPELRRANLSRELPGRSRPLP